MIIQTQINIIDCYNKTAKKYAEQFIDELAKKHFDRIFLKAFVNENYKKGKLIDLGCGPGQTTKFIADCSFNNIVGVDISEEMIAIARQLNPQINFEIADMLNLKYKENSFGSAIAFYSIVHFTYEQIEIVFREINKVLVTNGQFLFSYHVDAGDESIHLDNFLESSVNINFNFFETEKIMYLLGKIGFNVIDLIERQSYDKAEYPSLRAYVWVEKKNN